MPNLHNRSKLAKVHKKSHNICLYSSNLGTFWLKIKQFWPFEEIYISSNGGHLGWRAGLSDTILKRTHPGTIPARFGLIWFSGFREDLNVIFYQNMPNLHNRYKSAERKFFSLAAILVESRDHRTQFWKGAIQGPFHQSLVAIGPVVSEEKIKM